MAEEEFSPNLDEIDVFAATTKRWRPNPATEAQVDALLKDSVPLKLRASDKTFEEFYERGFQLYKTGKFKQALSHFQILITAHPKHPKYLMAAAAANQMLKQYAAAVGLYTLAAILDEHNPYPLYYLTSCLIKIEEPLQALINLEMGIERCEKLPHLQGLKDRMKMMAEQLHKELAAKKEEYLKKNPPPGDNRKA